MREQRYRLKTPTLVITVKDGQKTSITLPRGSEVEVLRQLCGDRRADVLWKRKTMMFTTAIRKRGEQLDGHHR
jgi:hypothetical protein